MTDSNSETNMQCQVRRHFNAPLSAPPGDPGPKLHAFNAMERMLMAMEPPARPCLGPRPGFGEDETPGEEPLKWLRYLLAVKEHPYPSHGGSFRSTGYGMSTAARLAAPVLSDLFDEIHSPCPRSCKCTDSLSNLGQFEADDTKGFGDCLLRTGHVFERLCSQGFDLVGSSCGQFQQGSVHHLTIMVNYH